MQRINRLTTRVTAAYGGLPVVAAPAAMAFLDLGVVVGAERAEVGEGVRSAVPAALDVIGCEPVHRSGTAGNGAEVVVALETCGAQLQPEFAAVEGVAHRFSEMLSQPGFKGPAARISE